MLSPVPLAKLVLGENHRKDQGKDYSLPSTPGSFGELGSCSCGIQLCFCCPPWKVAFAWSGRLCLLRVKSGVGGLTPDSS